MHQQTDIFDQDENGPSVQIRSEPDTGRWDGLWKHSSSCWAGPQRWDRSRDEGLEDGLQKVGRMENERMTDVW